MTKNNPAQATLVSTSSKPLSILKNNKETSNDTSTTQTTLRDSFVIELQSVDSIKLDNPSDNSAWGSERPSVPA